MPAPISISELARRLASPRPPRLVEALSPTFFADAHLPGAYNLPPAQVAVRAADVLPDLDTEVVVYCSDECDRARIVAGMLEDLGYQQVLLLDGGKGDWLAAGHRLERSDPIPHLQPPWSAPPRPDH